ncbi:MAG TPA: DUF4253 domain-containing protein [Kofleriaceae bacterium]|nr:DUF4253 domain-containing protein [Kofleriaceae bacterium]
MRTVALLSLALACACGTGAPAGVSAEGPPRPARKKQRRPGVNEWFTPAGARAPVDLAGSAAAGVRFTEYRRGRFRVWHARGIPGPRADAIWRALGERGKGDLVPLLVRDDVFHEGTHGQLVSDGGRVEREGVLSLAQALVVREKQLGEPAARMRAALASARPSESLRHSVASGEPLQADLDADPEGRPFDLALTVYRGPIEDVAPFLVSGAGLEPRAPELAAALRHWRQRYGAAPRRWTGGRALELAVERPPRALADLRALAWQFYLMCPAAPGGSFRDNEPADELLVRLEQRRWTCSWFVE